METWHLFINGQQVGPFTVAHLKGMAQANELPADAMAFDQASQQWLPLAQVPALATLAPVAYFCHHNNEQVGPFTVAQIKAQLAAGTLTATDLVFITASNDWQPLQASPLWAETAPAPVPPPIPAAAPAAKTPQAAAIPVTVKPAASRPAIAVESAPAKSTAKIAEVIQFPCKNHPNRESFLICRTCGADFCEDCLVEIAGTRYCKECQAAGKAATAEKKAGKLIGKLFKK